MRGGLTRRRTRSQLVDLEDVLGLFDIEVPPDVKEEGEEEIEGETIGDNPPTPHEKPDSPDQYGRKIIHLRDGLLKRIVGSSLHFGISLSRLKGSRILMSCVPKKLRRKFWQGLKNYVLMGSNRIMM